MKKWLSVLLVLTLALSTVLSEALAEEEPTISIYFQCDIGFDPATNPIVPALEKGLGVKLEFILPPKSQYTESLNLMINSGEYPDLIQFESTSSSAFQDSVKGGKLVALDDYIGSYDNLNTYIDPASLVAMRAAVSDGKLYGIPRNSVMRTDGYLIRADWLENVGIELEDCSTVSQEKFAEILHAFTYNDPDGNGLNDTFGLTIGSTSAASRIYPIIGSAGLLGWQEDADMSSGYRYIDAKYDRTSTVWTDGLKYFASLWKDGVVDPSDITNQGNSYRDHFYDGTCGVVYMFGGWLSQYETALHANFPEAATKYIVGIERADGTCQNVSTLGANTYGMMAISKAAQESGKVEKCLEVLNYLLSDEGWDILCNGVEGWTYTLDTDGKKVATDAFADFAVYRNSLSLLRRYNEPGYFVTLANTDFDRCWKYIQAACDITIGTYDLGYTPDVTQELDYMDYDTEVSVALNDIAIGNAEPETWFDVLNGWYECGGDTYVEQMNAFIESMN